VILAAEVPDPILGWALLVISTIALGVLGWMVKETISLRKDLLTHMGNEELQRVREEEVMKDLGDAIKQTRDELKADIRKVHERMDATLANIAGKKVS
jgi:hypothetical protein